MTPLARAELAQRLVAVDPRVVLVAPLDADGVACSRYQIAWEEPAVLRAPRRKTLPPAI